MASTPSATNITKPPKLTNGVANSIFNSADFGTTDTDKYVKKSGDVLTGSLTVPTLVCNGGITLQSVYPTLPSQTQIGVVFKVTATTATTDAIRNTVYSYATLSLPAGCYMMICSFAFKNDVIAPAPTYRPNITFSNIQGGFSTFTGDTPAENKTIQFYGQTVGDGGTITMNNSTFYQHNNSTNKTVYLNCYVGVNNNCSVTATFTAVRVG